jgi:hypothetical protein
LSSYWFRELQKLEVGVFFLCILLVFDWKTIVLFLIHFLLLGEYHWISTKHRHLYDYMFRSVCHVSNSSDRCSKNNNCFLYFDTPWVCVWHL